MFSKFDVTVQSDEQATRHEEERELLRLSALEAAREEARESLLGHIASEGLCFHGGGYGYEDYEPNPYDGTYSEE